MRSGRTAGAAILVAFSILAGPETHATDGNELIGIGAIQKGTAGAGVASPKDSTWALLNPASIVDLNKRLDFSFEYIDLFRGAEPRGFPLVVNPHAFHLTDHSAIFVPSFGMIFPLDTGTLGVGVFGVQGNRAEYDHPRTTLGLSRGKDRRSELQVAKIPISYAYEFNNGWSVGVSLLGALTMFRTDSLTLNLRPAEGDFEQDWSLGIGMQLALYKRWEKWRFGAVWTSRTAVQQYEKYEDALKWNLDIPEKVQVGLAWQVTPKLELVADYKWQGWSQVNQFAKPTIQGGLGWIDQNIIKFGATYQLNDKWTLRTGYSHGNSAVPDSSVFANTLSPGIAEDHFTFGFSHPLNEHADIHFAWTHTFSAEETENGDGDIFSKLGRGSKIEYDEDAYTLQYSYRF